jgi:hypothetical protein
MGSDHLQLFSRGATQDAFRRADARRMPARDALRRGRFRNEGAQGAPGLPPYRCVVLAGNDKLFFDTGRA